MLRPCKELAMELGPMIMSTATSPFPSVICQASLWCSITSSAHLHNNPMMQVSCPLYKQVNLGSEIWGYLTKVTQPTPQELALECRAAWLRSEQGAFHFLTPPHWVVTEEKILSQSKGDVYQPSGPHWASCAEMPQRLSYLMVLPVRLLGRLVQHPGIFLSL